MEKVLFLAGLVSIVEELTAENIATFVERSGVLQSILKEIMRLPSLASRSSLTGCWGSDMTGLVRDERLFTSSARRITCCASCGLRRVDPGV